MRSRSLAQLDRVEELRALADRQLADLVDVLSADRDRERRGPQPRALAHRARHEAHVTLDDLPHPIGLRLGVAALDPRDHAFVLRRVRTLTPVPVLVPDRDLLRRGAVEDDLLGRRLELLPRRRRAEAVLLAHRDEHPLEVLAAETRPRFDRALVDREVVVGDDQLGVDLEARAQPVALVARAVGRVEREVAGRELLERQPAVRAREVLGEREDLRLRASRPCGRSRPRRRPRRASARSRANR